MNNEEAIVVEHSTTDRIESLYDDIRSVEKRLGTVFFYFMNDRSFEHFEYFEHFEFFSLLF